MSKRGDQSPIAVVVEIILALAVLVVLILGFTLGWDKILPWIPKDNIQTTVTQCSVACSLNDKFNFCSSVKVLKDANNQQLVDINGKTKGQLTGNCSYFSDDSINKQGVSAKYGIVACATTPCA